MGKAARSPGTRIPGRPAAPAARSARGLPQGQPLLSAFLNPKSHLSAQASQGQAPHRTGFSGRPTSRASPRGAGGCGGGRRWGPQGEEKVPLGLGLALLRARERGSCLRPVWERDPQDRHPGARRPGGPEQQHSRERPGGGAGKGARGRREGPGDPALSALSSELTPGAHTHHLPQCTLACRCVHAHSHTLSSPLPHPGPAGLLPATPGGEGQALWPPHIRSPLPPRSAPPQHPPLGGAPGRMAHPEARHPRAQLTAASPQEEDDPHSSPQAGCRAVGDPHPVAPPQVPLCPHRRFPAR